MGGLWHKGNPVRICGEICSEWLLNRFIHLYTLSGQGVCLPLSAEGIDI